jgi:hypothetical protein
MSLTVQQLNNDHFEHLLILNVKEQLSIIDKKIMKLNKKIGYNELVTSLPHYFANIPYDRDIVTPLIYAKIMKSLEKRGFTVKITRANGKPPSLIIQWTNSIYSNKDIIETLDYLTKNSV